MKFFDKTLSFCEFFVKVRMTRSTFIYYPWLVVDVIFYGCFFCFILTFLTISGFYLQKNLCWALYFVLLLHVWLKIYFHLMFLSSLILCPYFAFVIFLLLPFIVLKHLSHLIVFWKKSCQINMKFAIAACRNYYFIS